MFILFFVFNVAPVFSFLLTTLLALFLFFFASSPIGASARCRCERASAGRYYQRRSRVSAAAVLGFRQGRRGSNPGGRQTLRRRVRQVKNGEARMIRPSEYKYDDRDHRGPLSVASDGALCSVVLAQMSSDGAVTLCQWVGSCNDAAPLARVGYDRQKSTCGFLRVLVP